MLRLTFGRRHGPDGDAAPWAVAVVFAAGLCVATASLVWLGYIATREWRHGADLLLERRQTEAIALVGAALNRDMEGAWARVVVPITQLTIEEEPPYNMLQRTARAFARFPYPESFIIWRATGDDSGVTYVFNRADRPPHWDTGSSTDDPFPVVVLRDPPALRGAITAVRQRAEPANPFVVVHMDIAGAPYQIVAHLLLGSTKPPTLSGLAAFTINLNWVRREYFGPLLHQVARIGGYEDTLSFAVTDDQGGLVTATRSAPAQSPDVRRRFPLLFLDDALIAELPSQRRVFVEWTVHVRASSDTTLLAALQGARRTFALMAGAAVASIIALLLTVRAVRASARLASMKSDFVSAVTHELKTPLALIRLVGDTLARGRYTSTETVQDYAHLLSQEASRLTHSIDNLLTYARYSDSDRQQPTEFTPTDVGDLVEDALESFRPTLMELGFQLTVNVPPGLPHVSADRAAMIQVMENVIDNAIKYSGDTRALSVLARLNGRHVQVTFADRGIGIAKEDLAHVFDRFYRGRNAKQSGSGLGLTIARRILRYHGGEIVIRSTVGVGTEVDLLLVAPQS